MPILKCLNTNKIDDGYGYAFICVNNGLGPAFIEDATYVFNNKSYNSIDDIVRQLPHDSTLTTSNLGKSWVIPEGERVDIVQVIGKKNANAVREQIGMGGLTVRFTYKSIYGQRWRMTYPADPDESNIELK